jgi:hypothetical protein
MVFHDHAACLLRFTAEQKQGWILQFARANYGKMRAANGTD